MSLMKQKRHTSKRITDSSRDQYCQLRLAKQCGGSDTTVAAHVQILGNGGTGTKPSDLFICDACVHCHAILDGHVSHGYDRDYLELTALRAMVRKQQTLLDAGLVQFKYK